MEIMHRCDEQGNEKLYGSHIKIKFVTNTVDLVGNLLKIDHICIVKEEILDDFAMNVMAEVDGAKG